MIGIGSPTPTSLRLAQMREDSAHTKDGEEPIPATPAQVDRALARRELRQRIYDNACLHCSLEKLGRPRLLVTEEGGTQMVCLLIQHAYEHQLTDPERVACLSCPVPELYARVMRHEVTDLSAAEVRALKPRFAPATPPAPVVGSSTKPPKRPRRVRSHDGGNV